MATTYHRSESAAALLGGAYLEGVRGLCRELLNARERGEMTLDAKTAQRLEDVERQRYQLATERALMAILAAAPERDRGRPATRRRAHPGATARPGHHARASRDDRAAARGRCAMTAPHLSPRVDEASRKLVREIADAFKTKRVARGDRQLDIAQYLGLREREICLFETQPSRFMTIAKALRALNIYGLTLAVVPINHTRNRE